MFLVNLFGLHKYMKEDLRVQNKEYVIIPLLGWLKNELGDQYRLTPLITTTNSRIKVKVWVMRLVDIRMAEKRLHGAAFVDCSNGEINYIGYERGILE